MNAMIDGVCVGCRRRYGPSARSMLGCKRKALILFAGVVGWICHDHAPCDGALADLEAMAARSGDQDSGAPEISPALKRFMAAHQGEV